MTEATSRPMRREVGVQISLRLPHDVVEALDEARGRRNRQTWIRETIVERLKDERFYMPRQPG